jgi:gliding motility-associated-like protein
MIHLRISKPCFALYALLVIAVLSTPQQIQASHAMGADISYECLGGSLYRFYGSLYRDCDGIPAPADVEFIFSNTCGAAPDPVTALPVSYFNGVDTLLFGEEISPLCDADIGNSTCNGGTLPGSQVYTYAVDINIPYACDDWIVSMRIVNRNNTIDNLMNPSTYALYVEAHLDNTSGACNSSPKFTQLPVTFICRDVPYDFNHGAVDPDGDSLVFTMINPLDDAGVNIPYVNPPYSVPYPITTTSGVFGFDASTGQFSFTPNMEQTCVVTVRVDEYRAGAWIGSTMRDIQIIVDACTNLAPLQTSPLTSVSGATALDSNNLISCPGNLIQFDVSFEDFDAVDSVSVSSNLDFAIPGASYTVTGTNPVTVSFSWPSTFVDTGFYLFSFSLTDNACPVAATSSYAFSIDMVDGTSAGPDLSYCPGGAPVQLMASGGSSFTWIPSTGLDDPFSATPFASPTVTTTYVLQSDLSGLCISTDTVTVFVDASTTLDAGPDALACAFGGAALDAIASGPLPPGGFVYAWTPVSGLSDTSISNPVADPAIPTTYYVQTWSEQGCLLVDSVFVDVDDLVSNAGPDTLLCPGVMVDLFAEGGLGYAWMDSSSLSCGTCTDPVLEVSVTQNYGVIITKSNGCVDTQYAEIEAYPVPLFSAGNDTSIQSGGIAQLAATPGFDFYSWTPVEWLSDPNVRRPFAEPEETTLFFVQANHSSGCVASDSVWVFVLDHLNVIVPNAFTPNGDGLNDQLSMIDRGIGEFGAFQIFNRWGELVFYSTDMNDSWDGTYKGKEAELGTYLILVEATDKLGEPFTYTGMVHLIR